MMTDFIDIKQQIEAKLALQPEQINIADFSELFKTISDEIYRQVGFKLITFTVIHPDNSHVIRLFSNQADAYALEDTKPVIVDEWYETVIGKMRPFKISTIKEMMPIFPDYQKIADMGLGSAINMPICLNDKCLGTVNLLDIENHYEQVNFEPLLASCQPAAKIFEAYRQQNCV